MLGSLARSRLLRVTPLWPAPPRARPLQAQRKLLADVKGVYLKALKGDAPATARLEQLVAGGHSGAACLALAKAGVCGWPRGAQASAWELERSPPEAPCACMASFSRALASSRAA